MATPRKRSAAGLAAEKLIEQSVELVDVAGKAHEELQRVEAAAAERIAAAREKYAAAYAAAVDGGWTPDRLAAVDLPDPDGGRPTRRRAVRKSTVSAPSQRDSGEGPAVDVREVDGDQVDTVPALSE